MSRGTWEHNEEGTTSFVYGAVTLYGCTFQNIPLDAYFVTSRSGSGRTMLCPTTPHTQRPLAYTYVVWAVPRSLAATDGIAVAFSSSRY